MNMTRRKYGFAAITTAILLIICVALCLVLGNTIDEMVGVGNSQAAYAAEISVDTGYVANGEVEKNYDATAHVPEGYTAQKITGEVGWNSYIAGSTSTENKYYYLTSDLTLKNIDKITEFKGILDGCGHTIEISQEAVLTTADGAEQTVGGLFKSIVGGTVKNVKIKVSLFSVGADKVGTKAGIIAGETSENAVVQNVRIDLNYASSESMDQADDKNRNVTYLYDYNQRQSGAPNYLILGGIAGDIAGDTLIDETTVSVNANAKLTTEEKQATTASGFGISGWRAADDADRYYILGGFAGRVNSGVLTMTNVNLEGEGKIYNFNESEESVTVWEGSIIPLPKEKHRNNYGFAGGFVGEVGGTAGGTLRINGLNYMFKGVLGKEHMNKSNATGAIVGSGGMDTNKTTVENTYFSSDSRQGNEYIMGDTGAQWYTGGIVYDISAPVYVSGGRLIIPAQQSTVWEEGKDALCMVTDREGNIYNVEYYMIVADESQQGNVYLSMNMFGNVPFGTNGQQDYGALYTLNFYTMGSADMAEGFTYAEDTNTYSFSKTYDGVSNAKDIAVYMNAGEKNKKIEVFTGDKANSGAAGEYSFMLDKSAYSAAGVEEYIMSNVEGNYIIDKTSGMLCRMNVPDDAKINVNISRLPVEIGFNGEGNVTYGDSLGDVKTNNPVSIVSVGGVAVGETVNTPDAFTGYTLTGYEEKTAAGTEVTLGLESVLMNGQEANYEFTLGSVTTVVKQYQIVGALEKDRFTTTEVQEGALVVFSPSTQLPDELAFDYAFATSADSTEWTSEMPVESNRYYVKVTFDNSNYNLETNVYTFTVTAVVTVSTTDKVIDGVFTTEYFNTAQKLTAALREAVDYDAEDKEESDYFVFSVDDVEIASALDARETEYVVTATLKSQRYEDASIEFKVKVVPRKISVSGDSPNASWAQLANGVYDGAAKESFGLVTEDNFAKTYQITYSATADGEYTQVEEIKNAGYYNVVAISANSNYEIVDGNGTYFVEKATPVIDFGNILVTLAYGATAVAGDTSPVVSGVYDNKTFNIVTLTESGDTYTAASVNAGGKVTVTAQDFSVENADNYNDVVIVDKEITVDKAEVSVVTTNKDITYGDELTYVATDFYSAVNGLVGEDAVTAEYSTDYVVKTAAGTALDVVLTFTFTNGNADNYLINNGEPVVAVLTVGKRLINGSLVAPDTTYDGMPYDHVYIDSESILEGDVVNCKVQYSLDNVTYIDNAPVDVGTYYVGITAVDNPNYQMGTIAGGVQFSIAKAAAPSITVNVKEGIVYDGKEKSVADIVTTEVNGLFAGDESLAGHVVIYCLNKIVDAGDYTLTAYIGGLQNYEDSKFIQTVVTVAKAPVTVTLKNDSVIYGNPLSGNESYFVSATGTIGGDKFSVNGYTYKTEYVAGQTAADSAIEVVVEYTLDNADNYIVNGGNALTAYLNVTKRALQGNLSATDKKYDGAAYNGVQAVWENLVGDDTVEVTFEYSADGKNYTGVAPVDAGTYFVRAAQVVANGNYEVGELESVEFTVSKADAPVITATVKNVVYSGQIVNPADTVEYTVSGLIAGDEGLADKVSVYSSSTILAAGDYNVGLVLKGLKNYNDAEPVIVTVTVARADKEIFASARMGYGYIEITVNDRNTVEYSFDNATWTALPAYGRIAVDVQGVVSVYLRYVQTQNYNATAAVKVDANITYDVLEEYVGRNYLDAEVSFANANEIAEVLGWQANAVGEKSDTYATVVGGLQGRYDTLINSAKETVVAALNAGANLSGYQKLAATVISVSVGGLALGMGALAIKKRKGGCDNEK